MSLFWKLGGVAFLCFAAWLLLTKYGQARYDAGKADEGLAWSAKVAEAERGKLAAFQAGLAHQQAAETHYVETIRTLPPITNTIVERSTAYAATPAGARECLPADRVLWLEQARGALFPAAPAAGPGSGTGTVSADAANTRP